MVVVFVGKNKDLDPQVVPRVDAYAIRHIAGVHMSRTKKAFTVLCRKPMSGCSFNPEPTATAGSILPGYCPSSPLAPG